MNAPLNPATPALELENVTMRINGLTAVDHASFAVPAGQIVSLIGPNGAGKTTTYNVISGYMKPTEGRVRLFGHDITGMAPEQSSQLGLVRSFQRTSVFSACTVAENILMALHLKGSCGVLHSMLRTPRFRLEEAALQSQAEEIMRFLGLTARAHEKASNLSYGEQRLLGVGLALAAKPKVLLLDEPAAGLNPSETEAFKDMVRRIGQDGVTVLLVEHDMHMVMSISDHIVVLNYGRVIATGTPTQIQNDPEVIRAYLGSGVERAEA